MHVRARGLRADIRSTLAASWRQIDQECVAVTVNWLVWIVLTFGPSPSGRAGLADTFGVELAGEDARPAPDPGLSLRT
jgi:hypothetical protein